MNVVGAGGLVSQLGHKLCDAVIILVPANQQPFQLEQGAVNKTSTTVPVPEPL